MNPPAEIATTRLSSPTHHQSNGWMCRLLAKVATAGLSRVGGGVDGDGHPGGLLHDDGLRLAWLVLHEHAGEAGETPDADLLEEVGDRVAVEGEADGAAEDDEQGGAEEQD